MPIFEYKCADCGKRFELIRTAREADRPIVCVNCQSDKTKRVLSVFNAQSGSKLIAGGNNSGCSSCSSGSCSSCNHN